MATKVMMEALSPTMEEGRLVKWTKNVGDAVKSGDTIAEVETDKAIMELVARGDGILRARLINEGATSAVGVTIGVIAAADEDISALAGGHAPTEAPSEQPKAVPASELPAPPTDAKEHAHPPAGTAEHVPDATPGGPVRSSPMARRIAAERGMNLQAIQGTGPGGRVIKRDIEAAASAAPGAAPIAAAPRPSASVPPGATQTSMQIDGEFRDVALTQMRKTIARRLGESIGPIPTFFLTSEIDMTNVGTLREQMVAAGDQFKVSVNDIVIKAVAIALTRHPEVNAHWQGESIRYFSAAHVGMAVATDDGLIVPVIRDAHLKGLGAIGREARDLAKKARERKLTPAEYSGGTFSVSNLGMFGIKHFSAVINPPHATILAVGAGEQRVVVKNGQPAVATVMSVTLSTDHRAVDGALGAELIAAFKQLIENPMSMLV